MTMPPNSKFIPVYTGSKHSANFRVFFKNDEQQYISPFHDIPLNASQAGGRVLNMVVEIPRWSNAKMEISTKDSLNPIKQDEKKGKLRFVHNIFPHHGFMWNYGALPQTWENPAVVDPLTGSKGDNDPVDVVEIGSRVAEIGHVLQVKVLGILAMLDEGETDWKVIAIDVRDPLAANLNSVKDIEKHMPGYLSATVEWFRNYKIPAGSPPNDFAFGGEVKDAALAFKVIDEAHKEWAALAAKTTDAGNISLVRFGQTTAEDAEKIVDAFPPEQPDSVIPDEVDVISFVDAKLRGMGDV
jgi:nucleosome-remodeling factor subunit